MSTAIERPVRLLYVAADSTDVATLSDDVEAEIDHLRVETTDSGEGALSRLDEVDCIVAAYDLPDTDGVELIESVRETHEHLPFILVVHADRAGAASGAVAAGLSDLLVHDGSAPSAAELASAIESAVETARQEQKRRRKLRAIDTTKKAISILNEDAEFIYVNQAYGDLYGYDPDEMLGENIELIYPEGTIDVAQADVVPTLEERGIWHGETPGLRSDGSTFVEDHWLAVTGEGEILCTVEDKTQMSGSTEAIQGLHSTVNDLIGAETAQDVAELTVKASEIFVGDSANAVYYYHEDEDRLEPAAWTGAAEEYVEDVSTIERGEGTAWTVYETGTREVYEGGTQVPGAFRAEPTFRSELLFPIGEHGILVVASPTGETFGEAEVALVQTLAAQATTALDGIQSQQALRAEREFIDQALSTLNDVFYVLSEDGSFSRWNDRLTEVAGHPDEAVAGMSIDEMFPEEDRDQVHTMVERALAAGDSTFEAPLRTAAGDRIPHEFSNARLTDPEGDVIGVVGIGRDVSRRKERERQLREQNDRLESFSSIISHDLRSPLNVAEGRLQMAQSECNSEYLDAVASAHDRMGSLIEDLLAIAREGETALELEPVELAAEGEAAWSHVQTDGATLVTDTERTIRADPGRLEQLLENLFRNAIEHGGSDVTVTVGDLEDGFYVEDDGPGIPEADRERVLEPGYSSTRHGTGLGLNIVASIAEAHDWVPDVAASDSGGARIEFTGVA